MTKLGLLLLTIAATSTNLLSGCAQSEAPNERTTELGSARLTLLDEGHLSGSLKIGAKVAATGVVVRQTLVRVDGKSSVDLALAPGSYLLEIEAYADAAATALLGSKSKAIDVGAGAMTALAVQVSTHPAGGVALAIATEAEIAANGGAAAGGLSAGADVSGGATAGGATVGGSATAGGDLSAGGSTTAGGDVSAGAGAGASTGGSTSAGAGASAGGGVSAGGTTAGGASAGGNASAGGAVAAGDTTAGGSASAGGTVSGSGAAAGGSASAGASAGDTSAGVGAEAGTSTGGSTSAGGSVAAGGAVSGTAAAKVVIHGVDVSVGATSVQITVRADAGANAALHYLWTGAGFSGAVAGSASATVDVKTILEASTHAISVLVESDDGAAVSVNVTFDVGAAVLGVLKLPGTHTTTISQSETASAATQSCWSAHAQCAAACSASLTAAATRASCTLKCATALALCL